MRAKPSAAPPLPLPSRRDPDFFEFYRSMSAYGTALDRARHDDGAVAGFGVLPLLPQCRMAAAGDPADGAGRRSRSGAGTSGGRAPAADASGCLPERSVSDFLAAIGLVLVIEGLVYGGFPNLAKKLAEEVLSMPENAADRRAGGDRVGVGIVWLVRGCNAGIYHCGPVGKAANTPYFLPTWRRAIGCRRAS